MAHKLYQVGGSVRDKFIGRPVHDMDFVLVGATFDEAKSLYGEPVGKSFPVFINADGHEVAMARRERKSGQGHTGFTCDFGPDVTIQEDLARRDFTVNAIAIDVETHDVFDPFHGFRDIVGGTLRAVGPAFSEDPLRVYRMARFAAVLEYDVVPETLALASTLVPELASLSGERVAQEMIKALEQAEKPSAFFRVLLKIDALKVHFPELQALVDVPAGPPEHHQEGSAFEHTMMVLDAVVGFKHCPVQRFGALVHDLGKGLTPKAELPKHKGHDDKIELVQALYDRLKLPAEYLRFGQLAMSQHMRMHELTGMTTKKIVKFVHDISRHHEDMYRLIKVVEADGRGRIPSSESLAEGDIILRAYEAMKSLKPMEIIAAAEKSRAERALRMGLEVPEKITGAHIGQLIHRAEIDAVNKVLEAHRVRS